MSRTTHLNLEKIASRNNIAEATFKACRGKRNKPGVMAALNSYDQTITRISHALREGRLPIGAFTTFTIHDPKKRTIHAAPLLDRIAHHALMHYAGPRLERALLPSVYACRVNKGVHRAVLQAQQQARRFRWVMHTDIRHYFPAIDHWILFGQLHRRFRGDGCVLLQSVIESHGFDEGRGLPIGALTSQHFANHYLSEMDRWCLAQSGIGAHCRYMDDQLLWSNDKGRLVELQYELQDRLRTHLKLEMKPALIQRTSIGITFCGIRIKPWQLRASTRRRRRYKQALDRLEQRWYQDEIDELTLQQGYAAINAMLLPANDWHFRRRVLAQREPIDA
jgi:hypothetical protein